MSWQAFGRMGQVGRGKIHLDQEYISGGWNIDYLHSQYPAVPAILQNETIVKVPEIHAQGSWCHRASKFLSVQVSATTHARVEWVVSEPSMSIESKTNLQDTNKYVVWGNPKQWGLLPKFAGRIRCEWKNETRRARTTWQTVGDYPQTGVSISSRHKKQ